MSNEVEGGNQVRRKVEDSFKIVTVGDGAVGKTCLLVCYSEHRFPEEYVPTVFENYHSTAKFRENFYGLEIYDTAGQENLGELRVLCYPGTDIFVLCFSICEPTSFENIRIFWANDLKLNGPKKSKVILVGTKQDLREDSETLKKLLKDEQSPVSRKQGEKLAKEIGAIAYLECSSKLMSGVNEVFQKAVEVCVLKKTAKKKKKGIFNSLSKDSSFEDDFNFFSM